MDYAVRRLNPESGGPPSYRLMDEDGELLMVAEQPPSPAPDERRQVRLTRPDGRLLATIDLPGAGAAAAAEEQGEDFAIVHDYAVYAILSVNFRANGDREHARDAYFTLEVEGEKWLVLPHPDIDNCFAIYDDVPAGLHTYNTITELDLPPFIGHICSGNSDYAFRARIDAHRLEHTQMIILALAFLIDRVSKAA